MNARLAPLFGSAPDGRQVALWVPNCRGGYYRWYQVTSARDRVRLLSLEDAETVALLEGHRLTLEDVAFACDGALLIAVSRDGMMSAWRREPLSQ